MAENIEMNQATEEADLSEVLQVRRDKLAGLIESGKNPFEITKIPKALSLRTLRARKRRLALRAEL